VRTLKYAAQILVACDLPGQAALLLGAIHGLIAAKIGCPLSRRDKPGPPLVVSNP
jgi:hypothetical protein